MNKNLNILVIEDDDDHARIVKRLLKRSFNAKVFRACSLSEGCKLSSEIEFDAALVDLSLPDSDPEDTLKEFVTCNPFTPTIVLSSLEDDELARSLLKEGAQDYLRKANLNQENIIRSIRYSIERKALQKKLKQYSEELERRNVDLEKIVDIRTEKLSKSEMQYKQLVKDAPMGILTFNKSGKIIFANPEFSRIFGYKIGEEAKSVFDLVPEESKPILQKIQKEMVKNKHQPIKRKVYLQKVDGSLVWTHVTISPIVTSQEPEEQFLLLVDDHSDLIRQEEIEKKKRVAEQANQAKTEFLTNVSHEIKTPLTAICGFIDVLSHKILDPELKQYLQSIQRNSKHLLLLVKDLLDLAKIESGQLETYISNFSVVQEISWVEEMIQPLLIGKSVEVKFDYIGLMPRTIRTDLQKFRQILINLINNAIKYTEFGTIRVSVKFDYDKFKGQGEFVVRVLDPGLGISKDYQQKLFSPFNREERKKIYQQDGMGVGLSLSRQLALSLGGNVSLIHSSPGEGSEFEVRLPVGNFNNTAFYRSDSLLAIEKRESGRKDSEIRYLLRNKKILVVEDVEDIQLLTKKILMELGASVELVSNGQMAIEKAAKTQYDLILMDLSMPVKDGFQAIKEMRKTGYKGKVFALTAHAFKSEKEKCLSIGFDGFIPKPFSRASLLKKVSENLSSREVSDERYNSSRNTGDLANKRIFEVFSQNFSASLDEIKISLRKHDAKSIKKIAHKIKGSSGCFGFSDASGIAAEIEDYCGHQNEIDWLNLEAIVAKLDLEKRKIDSNDPPKF